MILRLARLPTTLAGPSDPDYRGHVPLRALFLHPDAAQSQAALESVSGGLVYTDIFRSADASLAAIAKKRGVQRPAYSAHNYGLAFDLDVPATLHKLDIAYVELTDLLQRYGWYCHRRDGNPTESESWHFNYLGENSAKYLIAATIAKHETWARPVEMRIMEFYGASFMLSTEDEQTALARLRLYSGEIDGLPGPLTREAIRTFQRAWNVDVTAIQRTLAYVSAQVQLELAGTALPVV